MCGVDPQEEKHFNYHSRAQKFDPESRFGCLHGRTAFSRMATWVTDPRRWGEEATSLQVERPQSDQGILVSALDLATPRLWGSTAKSATSCRVLVKRGDAYALMEDLAALGAATDIQHLPDHRRDFTQLTFSVVGAGHRFDRTALKRKPVPQLLRAPPIQVGDDQPRPRPFVKLEEIAPAEIDGTNLTLHAKLKWSDCASENTRRGQGLRPTRAFVSHGMPGNPFAAHMDCWIATNREAWLEVDLGADCCISHISTMGRFPPMMSWPKNQRQFDVVNEDHSGWENWTTRYEVSVRAESGRSWMNLGAFRGNADMTSEVVHDLSVVLQSKCAIRCRFLRFRPLGFRGKPALRVGVYGAHSQIQGCADVPEQLVTYKFPVMLARRNMRKVQRDFVSRRSYSPDYYGKYGSDFPSQRRRAALRRSVKREQLREEVDVSDDDSQSGEPAARSLPLLHEWLPPLPNSCVARSPSSASWELVSADVSSVVSSEWEMC